MAGGIEAEELAIERVRQPRQRMPVVFVERGEGPRNCPPAKARLDVRVLGNVGLIVVVDEGIMVDGIVDGDGCQDEQQGCEDELVARGRLRSADVRRFFRFGQRRVSRRDAKSIAAGG